VAAGDPVASAEEAKAWAERGLEDLWDDLQEEKFPMRLEEVSLWIRAAYGRGYCQALAEPEPTTILDAFERNAVLQVLVPVT
jgi:hypothetical protein